MGHTHNGTTRRQPFGNVSLALVAICDTAKGTVIGTVLRFQEFLQPISSGRSFPASLWMSGEPGIGQEVAEAIARLCRQASHHVTRPNELINIMCRNTFV
jgi:hypothetical protein